MAPSGLHTFLTHHVSNHSGEHPFATSYISTFALLSVIADIKTDSTGITLLMRNVLELKEWARGAASRYPRAISCWSSRRGLNSQQSAWKADALPIELLLHIRIALTQPRRLFPMGHNLSTSLLFNHSLGTMHGGPFRTRT